jgi:hypothetical protein
MATIKKSYVKKAQKGKKVPETSALGDDLSISNAVRRLMKNPKDVDNIVNQGLRLNPITQSARAIAEGITRIGGALGNKGMKKENARKDSIYEAQKKELQKNKKGGMIKKKMKNGGSVAGGTKAPAKRVGPVDPKGAFTKVQERTLAGAKGKASLTKDKELGATKMKMGGVMKAEGGKWIQKAIKKPGALRAQLGAKPGKPIPAGKLATAAKKPGKLGQRARLAQTLKKMKK